ncbi:MAG: hypothetical protein WC709_10200, partial [Thermoleophilia bacterium]
MGPTLGRRADLAGDGAAPGLTPPLLVAYNRGDVPTIILDSRSAAKAGEPQRPGARRALAGP